jgi:hypothetical protein
MDEARRPARRAAGEVVPLDERGAQAAKRGVACDAGARDSAADDEQVEDLVAECAEEGVAVGSRGVAGRRIVLWESWRPAIRRSS